MAGLSIFAVLAAAASVVVAVHGGTSASASGDTVTLVDSGDSYTSSVATHKVYGTSTRLTAGTVSREHKVIYLKFSIPAAVASQVQSATLTLTRDSHHLSGTVSAVRVASAAWNEKTLDFANAPAKGAVLSKVTTSRATNTVSLDVTPAAVGQTAVSIAITSSLTSDVARFYSREGGKSGPVLTLKLRAPASAATTVAPVALKSSSTAAAATTSASAPSSSASSSTSTSAAPSPSATAVSLPPSRSNCTYSVKLVSSCGVLWGNVPQAFTTIPLATALAQDEAELGRNYDIVHQYHTNTQLFPTTAEREVALQPGSNRLLFENWKPATDMSWAQVAAGDADSRIDAEAAYLKSTFNYAFFLTIWHEPENDVIATAGSGMTAADYSNMFSHVIERLRADGVTKAVTVMDYMGYVPWAQQSWFSQLWPGNNVVDWVGIDPYASGDATGYMSGDFTTLVNRTATGFPGFYTWITTAHPGLPIMVGEWGVKAGVDNPNGKANYYRSVENELPNYPDIHALVYFETPMAQIGPDAGDTEPNDTPQDLAAFKQLADNPEVSSASGFSYASDGSLVAR